MCIKVQCVYKRSVQGVCEGVCSVYVRCVKRGSVYKGVVCLEVMCRGVFVLRGCVRECVQRCGVFTSNVYTRGVCEGVSEGCVRVCEGLCVEGVCVEGV